MTSAAQKRARPYSYASCAWCGERKPIQQMRHPQSSRGKTPSTCHACREAHPDEAWCDHHGEPHARSKFISTLHRPIGVHNICREAITYKAAAKRAKPHRQCPSCDEIRESWYFRGGRAKSPVCRVCEEARPGQRWCIGCSCWLPGDQFYRTGVDNRYQTVRCKVCRLANDHGVTREQLQAMNGGDPVPKCAACGSREDVKIDHDHTHCPAHRGCAKCVRGYLCHQCNTAEGLLRTAERARLLAAYMDRWGGSS